MSTDAFEMFGTAMLRVTVLNEEGRVRVQWIGGDKKVGKTRTVHISELPDSVQHKLAVLAMRSYDPPTELVENIGRRIDRDTFWVFEPET